MAGIKVGLDPRITKFLGEKSKEEVKKLYDEWFFETLDKHNPTTYSIFKTLTNAQNQYSQKIIDHVGRGKGIGNYVIINEEAVEPAFESWILKKFLVK